MGLPDELKPVFQRIEALAGVDEHVVAQALSEYHNAHPALAPHIERVIFAEQFAFTLCTDLHGERGCWGAYFRPMLLTYEGGGGMTTHALDSLPPDTFAY